MNLFTGLSQSNQRSVYENEYVRKAPICVLVRIAQLVEQTDQLSFRRTDFARSNLANYFYYLFFYLFIIHFYIFFHSLLSFSFICLFYFL